MPHDPTKEDVRSRPDPDPDPGLDPGPVAELRNVSKRFGDVLAADALDLRIARGEFLSFLGPSGCGKTTALRLLAGFETPSSGDILLDGRKVNALAPYRRPVNMVFQSYALFPHLTVAGNIAFGLRQRRPRPDRRTVAAKVRRALEVVRLANFEERRVWEMSGGQQQRVALARAIVNEPSILLLDEPLAALDRKLRKEMQIELQDLQRQLGITFVLVTHDQEEALSLSDRICLMRAGRIVQTGTPQELYDRPQSRYVADFVGVSNFFNGVVTRSDATSCTARLKDGTLVSGHSAAAFPEGASACVSIRPEQVRLARGASDGARPVTVLNRIFLGEHTEYRVRSAALGEFLILAPRQADINAAPPLVGETVFARWDPGGAVILADD